MPPRVIGINDICPFMIASAAAPKFLTLSTAQNTLWGTAPFNPLGANGCGSRTDGSLAFSIAAI